MLSLMLDFQLKSLCIIFSFVDREQGVVIVQEYDMKSLYLILIKCHEHLHPSIEFENSFVDHNIF
jgi:hypothetical protein